MRLLYIHRLSIFDEKYDLVKEDNLFGWQNVTTISIPESKNTTNIPEFTKSTTIPENTNTITIPEIKNIISQQHSNNLYVLNNKTQDRKSNV